MFCKNCGCKLEEGTSFCLKCGFKNGNGDQYCSKCGNKVEKGQSICIKCGFMIDDVEKTENRFDNYIPLFKKEKYLTILSSLLAILVVISTFFTPIFQMKTEYDLKDLDDIGDLWGEELQEVLENDGVLTTNFSIFDDVNRGFEALDNKNTDDGEVAAIKFLTFFMIFLLILVLLVIITPIKTIIREFKNFEVNSSYAEKRYKQLKGIFAETNIYKQAKENSKVNDHINAIVASFMLLIFYIFFGLSAPSDFAIEAFYITNLSSVSAAIIVPILIVIVNFYVAHLKIGIRDKIKEEILEAENNK